MSEYTTKKKNFIDVCIDIHKYMLKSCVVEIHINTIQSGSIDLQKNI